jgi:DNA-binding NtrC family response regulator
MDDKMTNGIETEVKRSPLTVIVAERYPIARAALAALLSYDGYRVFQADSAKAALSHITSVDNLAVLLADLDMPGWRSIVRYAAQTTDALVIGTEGNHPFSEMYDLKEHGIRLCLKKPLIYDDVRTAINENIHASESVRHEARRMKAA